MFIRSFKVKGEDVNDFMVMQNFAYLSHSSKLIEVFLLEKGFSKLKLNSLKIGWQKTNDTLINKKHLMFAEFFSIELSVFDEDKEEGVTRVSVDFHNTKNELCATLTTDLHWFDYSAWEIINPPKKIARYFVKEKELRRAV
tara:strand:- start:34024 stop:34446 length:423 start_codon:yes stop_codon:yes gene_type:complete